MPVRAPPLRGRSLVRTRLGAPPHLLDQFYFLESTVTVSSPVRTDPAPRVPDNGAVGSVELVHRIPRTSLLDRFVMRIAVGMLIWSTRPDGEHTPHISVLADDPRAPLYARHASDASLARGALFHGVFVQPAGR